MVMSASNAIKFAEETNLHLIHTLLGVPMQKRLSLEHGSELVTDTLEEFLDSSRITQERDSHLEPTRCNITLRSEHIVGDPLDEVSGVLVLDILHLLFDFLHGY